MEEALTCRVKYIHPEVKIPMADLKPLTQTTTI